MVGLPLTGIQLSVCGSSHAGLINDGVAGWHPAAHKPLRVLAYVDVANVKLREDDAGYMHVRA
jgi:hypothetical protein